MRHLLLLFLFLSILSCSDQKESKEFTFTTSDETLQEIFDWAKEMALTYVGDSLDAVGPWYEASLPQREAFCMRDVSHQSGAGEILGLSKENFNMFARFMENISESKDWCTYWEIDRYNKPAPVDYRNEKEFWYNLNANFDVLDACYRTYLWTGDERYIRDPQFLFFYEKTMTDYISRWQLEADKIMNRPRFMNSPEPFNIEDPFHKCRGLASYVENFEGLTVSADLLASIYRACLSYSEILRLNGDPDNSKKYAQLAEKYADVFESEWWDNSEGLYNTFYTENKEFHKGEGETFILWFGVSQTPERIRSTVNNILSHSWNVENMSYFPKILYTNGYNWEAYETLKTIRNIKRNEYPEVSYGVIEGIICGVAGIHANASQKCISTLSRLQNEGTDLAISHLPVLGGTVTVEHTGTTKTIVENHCVFPVKWKAIFPGQHVTIDCNGKKIKAITESDLLGNDYSFIETELKPGVKAIASLN